MSTSSAATPPAARARVLDAAAFEVLRAGHDGGRAPGDGAAGRALRRRFGVPVWQLLGAGFVGTCAVGAFWYSRTPTRRKVARGVALTVDEPVVEAAQAEALMDEVRSVLERRGLSLGDVAIEVKLFGGRARSRASRQATAAPPPRDRADGGAAAARAAGAARGAGAGARVYARVDVAAGLPAHARRAGGGLCELGSHVYLLSCLHEPPDDGAAVLERDEVALRAEFRSPETTRTRTTAAASGLRSLRGRDPRAAEPREGAPLPPPVV